jgi:hypothetical protein
MTKLTIDRFEGNYAICELPDKSLFSIPKYKLPLHCREGDCLICNSNGMYQMDVEEQKIKEKRILEKMKRLLK